MTSPKPIPTIAVNDKDKKAGTEIRDLGTAVTQYVAQRFHFILAHNRDETGGFREHIFHRDFGTMIRDRIHFDSETSKASLIERKDNTGDKSVSPKSKSNDVCFRIITCIDLPLVNKEAGLAAGDEALKNTVRFIETIRSRMQSSTYHLYGQDFVSVKDSEGDLDDSILESLKSMQVFYQEGSPAISPSVTRVNLSDLIEDFNRFLEKAEREDMRGFGTIQKYFANFAMQRITWAREFTKLMDLGERMIKSVELEKQGEVSNEALEHNYEMYIKNFFSGTDFFELESFRGDPEKVQERLEAASFKLASEMALETDDSAQAISMLSKQFLVKQKISEKTVRNLETLHHNKTHQPGKHIRHAESGVNAEITRRKDEITKLMKMDEELYDWLFETEPEKEKDAITLIKETKELILNLRSYFEITDVERETYIKGMAETPQVDKGKSPEKDKSSPFEQLIDQIDALSPDSLPKKTRRGALIFLHQVIRGGLEGYLVYNDLLTGLRNKTYLLEFYVDNPNREEMTSVVIDLGFLKYFNKFGGRDTGDTAIQAAAEVLRRVGENTKGSVVVRVGGDEFVLLLRKKANYSEVLKEISSENAELGPIPCGPHARALYRPSELVFNIGVCTENEAIEIFEEILQSESMSKSDAECIKSGSPAGLELRKRIIAEIALLKGNAQLERFKGPDRLGYICGIYKRLGELQGNERLMEEEKLAGFLAHSGKALRGIPLVEIARIVEKYENLDELTLDDWEKIFLDISTAKK